MSKSRGRGSYDYIEKDVRNKQERRNERREAAKRKHQALAPTPKTPRRGG
jgi:hypothetical protein